MKQPAMQDLDLDQTTNGPGAGFHNRKVRARREGGRIQAGKRGSDAALRPCRATTISPLPRTAEEGDCFGVFAGNLALFRHGRACSGHPRLQELSRMKAWMPGIKPGMTTES
jgi:hypothetical protein